MDTIEERPTAATTSETRALGRALDAAIDRGEPEAVRDLLARGAPLDPWLPGGQSAFARAWDRAWRLPRDAEEAWSREACAAALYRHEADRALISENALLRLCIEHDRTDALRALANEGVDLNKPRPWEARTSIRPIDLAARCGSEECIRELARAGASLDADQSATSQALGHPPAPLAQAVAAANLPAMKTLLNLGVNPLGDQWQSPFSAPLCLAVAGGEEEMVDALLGAGATPDLVWASNGGPPTADQPTAEAYALFYLGEAAQGEDAALGRIADALLRAGADLSLRMNGVNALHHAARRDNAPALSVLSTRASPAQRRALDADGLTAADTAEASGSAPLLVAGARLRQLVERDELNAALATAGHRQGATAPSGRSMRL